MINTFVALLLLNFLRFGQHFHQLILPDDLKISTKVIKNKATKMPKQFIPLKSNTELAFKELAVETIKKNIVVIGAGYGGITAALRLARLFHRLPNYQIHLVDKNPYHTLKTQLHEAAVRKTEITIPIERIVQGGTLYFTLEK